MFIPIKSTDGAMTPFEYIEAAAGTYQVGQLLNVTDGKLAAISADQATTPPYVCMQSGTVAAGELLAVTRVQGKYTFETELAAAAVREGRHQDPGGERRSQGKVRHGRIGCGGARHVRGREP